MVAGRLGASGYAAQITGRGGTPVYGEHSWTTLGYGRVVNQTAEARLEWDQADARLPATFVEAEPWEHDLVIWRTSEPDPVFAGPVRTCDYESGKVTITARDPSAWFERRRNYTDVTYTDVDLAYIFGRIAADALAQDPTPDINLVVSPCGLPGTRVLRAAEAARTADLLRELARSGVDWCAVGRTLLIGGPGLVASLGDLVLTDDAVTEPRLGKAGDATATRETIRWQQAADQAPMLKVVSSPQVALLGLLEDVVEEPDIADDLTAGQAAQARLDLYDKNPRVWSATLTPDAPCSVAQLVPTRRCDFRISSLPVTADGVSRLRQVTVSVTQDSEQVVVNATPLGATDE